MTPSSNIVPCVCKKLDCPIPFGICHCGCGTKTTLAILYHPDRGIIRVTPSRFAPRHRLPMKRPGVLVPYCLDGESCFAVPLTDGQFAVIDVADGPSIGKYRWSPLLASGNTYAIRKERGRVFLMHREILGLVHGDSLVVDHIATGNTLDNRRRNLRVATKAQNARNRVVRSESRSGIKGVRLEYKTGKWTSRINGKHLGTFVTKGEAIKAYNVAATELFGEFASLTPSPHDSAHTTI
jgi:hypothetical protein